MQYMMALRPRRSVPRREFSACLSKARSCSETTVPRLVAVLVAALLLGCMRGDEPVSLVAPDVNYISSGEVDRLVREAGKPALFEFCVPAGCYRCDQMREVINDLAQQETEQLTVRRVNLNVDRQLAAEWGVTVCPTYIVVADGREIGRSQYPTSAELILAMVPAESSTD